MHVSNYKYIKFHNLLIKNFLRKKNLFTLLHKIISGYPEKWVKTQSRFRYLKHWFKLPF